MKIVVQGHIVDVTYDKAANQFVGEVRDLPGCITVGEDLLDLEYMIEDALRAYLEVQQQGE